MKPLASSTRHELLAILRSARTDGARVDGPQAARDCAAIIDRLPQAIAASTGKSGRGRKQTAISVLAALAADTYFHHTGKGPGSTVNESGKLGGHYPKFVGALAKSADIPHDPLALPRLCNEVRKALSASVGLGRSRGLSDYALREAARAGALKSHVIGYENLDGISTDDHSDGFPVFGGYEPARHHVSAKRRFGAFLKGIS
jgi:hypothetical protein